MLLLYFEDYAEPALRLAQRLDARAEAVQTHHFPDQEVVVRLPATVDSSVVIVRSLNQPNEKLIELMMAAATARELGAKTISLVAPYLCYMRQDKAFVPGQAVSQRVVAGMLDHYFDQVITVDPHLHRIQSLDEVFRHAGTHVLSAAGLIGEFVQHQYQDALLLGPDEESEQWVAAAAKRCGFPHAVASKERLGDTRVRISLPDFDFTGRTVVIVDDIISSGGTIIELARMLKEQGASEVVVVITHSLYSIDVEQRMQLAGVDQVWSTDSVLHNSNCIQLDGLLASALDQAE